MLRSTVPRVTFDLIECKDPKKWKERQVKKKNRGKKKFKKIKKVQKTSKTNSKNQKKNQKNQRKEKKKKKRLPGETLRDDSKTLGLL